MLPRENDAKGPALPRLDGRRADNPRFSPPRKRQTLEWPWAKQSSPRRQTTSARRSNLPSAEKVATPNKGFQRYLFLGLLFVFSQAIFLQSRVFKVQAIEVDGTNSVKKRNILRHLGLAQGESMWSVGPRQLAKNLVSQREIYQATVSYSLPGRVHVTIQERKPVLQLSSIDNPQNWFLLDAEGIVLRPIQSPQPNLPRLMVTHEVTAQTRLHPKTVTNLGQAIRTLDPNLAYTVWYYLLDEHGGLQVKTFANRSVVQVLLGDVQGAARKGAILEAIRARLAKDFASMRPVQIDLRTNSPSVRFDKPLPTPANVTPATGH